MLSPYRERVLQRAIDAARASPTARERVVLLMRIALNFGPEGELEAIPLWREALASWSDLTVHQLVEIAEHTRGTLREEALDKALHVKRRFDDHFMQLRILGALSPQLPEPVLAQRLDRLLSHATAAKTLGAWFWNDCVNWLPASLRMAYWPRIHDAASQGTEARDRLGELLSLLPWAPPEEQRTAMMACLEAMEADSERLATLPLAPHGDDQLSSRRERRHERERVLVQAIMTLASHASAAGVEERLVALAQKLGTAGTRVAAFAALAQRLPSHATGLREAALQAMEELDATTEGGDGIWGTRYDIYQQALSALLPLLSPVERRRLLTRAAKILEEEARWQDPKHSSGDDGLVWCTFGRRASRRRRPTSSWHRPRASRARNASWSGAGYPSTLTKGRSTNWCWRSCRHRRWRGLTAC